VSRILLTGATGFLGSAIMNRICAERHYTLRVACRHQQKNWPEYVERVYIDTLGQDTDWNTATQKVNVIIHSAARVHILKDNVRDSLQEYRRVNVAGTLKLAQEASENGVKRFIFISSIKVNGESTQKNRPFTVYSKPEPEDLYGISKLEAEEGLLRLSKSTGMEIAIIRPPLVYGPGVKANFLKLLHTIASGIPLPLSCINNKRSIVALENVVDLILTCVDHPAAANQIFLVSDGEDLSTPELVRRIGLAMGRRVWLYPVPPSILIYGAYILGKQDAAQRLCSSLQVDISRTCELLGWHPAVSINHGIASVSRWYLDNY